MSALEQEILDKFRLLDKAARSRVQAAINQEAEAGPFDFASWLKRVQRLQDSMRQEYGADHRVDVVSLLREVREEEG